MDKWQQLKQQFSKIEINRFFAQLTTLGIGGAIKAFFAAETEQELVDIIICAEKAQLPYMVIGGGSNLLASDDPLELLVVQNNVSGIESDGELIKVKAGTALQVLVDYSIKNGLGQMHKMTGIPGTVGGAIYGNAGAYGQMIGDYIDQVYCLDPENGQQITLSKDQCVFVYRDSGFRSKKLLILSATFKLPAGDKDQLVSESVECLTLRQKKYHPGIKCPGSFFRNMLSADIPAETLAMLPPRQDTFGKTPAYVFLEELGAKGDKMGDIEIADHHANLFINLGHGTAKDFYALAQKWHKQVQDHYRVNLEPEVQFVNLPPLQ